MMNHEWRVEARQRPDQFVLDIWIFRMHPDGRTIAYIPKGDDTYEDRTFEPGTNIPPTLTLNRELAPLLAAALKNEGVRLPEESFTKGKLEATQDHLQDLRQLLNLKDVIQVTGKPS